jgi:hypothetical protein
MQLKILAVLLLGLMWTIPGVAEATTFSPAKGVDATVVLEGSTLVRGDAFICCAKII